MAEKAPEPLTREEKINQAKEFYARGYRNYVVGDFNEAAEDLSHSCELYAELFGDESEEVAVPNLFYGKTLIELAQMGENKVLALPDQEEDKDDDDEDEEEDGPSTEGVDTNAKEETEMKLPTSANGSKPSPGPSSPQPGTSSGIQAANGNENAEEANEGENLQFAWEALEMAAKIFRRLGVGYEEYLAEAHYGLGEILMENQNCAEAIRDYNIAFDLFSKLTPIKERCLAEIKYKTGLCHYTASAYDESMADFQQSANYMAEAINAQKAREQSADVLQTIEDLTKMREDILIKIADVKETKEMIRNKLITTGGYGTLLAGDSKSDGTDAGSSNQSDKPKANDISHLIKRKKPDPSTDSTTNSDGLSPAKKQAL